MRTSLGMQSLSDCKQNLQAVSSVTFDVILPFRTFAENREVNHLSDLALFFFFFCESSLLRSSFVFCESSLLFLCGRVYRTRYRVYAGLYSTP